ncbi:MAG: integrase core domain-containing protein, partial [Chloroflexota bacterium]
KFTEPFDNVFRSEGIHIIRTPVRAPNANALAESWIRSIRNECLDKLIIVNASHLRRVVSEYVDFYNNCRPHQGIQQSRPLEPPDLVRDGPVQRREVLGGVINDYHRRAA